MRLTFTTNSDSKTIIEDDFNNFQKLIGQTLPQDYRQHMLFTQNGGIVEEDVVHINYQDEGGGIRKFYPIKYGFITMEDAYKALNGKIPSGYISIGKTTDGGEIIISLNTENYGEIKGWHADGTLYDLSKSFTDLLNEMVEAEDY